MNTKTNTNMGAYKFKYECKYRCNITSVSLQLGGIQWHDYGNAICTFEATVIAEDHFSASIIP